MQTDATKVSTLPGDFADDLTIARTRELFNEHRQVIFVRTDRMFGWLMPLQWLVGVCFALWVSPHAWAGREATIHPHVWAALLLGGVITIWPVYCAHTRPGTAMTRQTIAIGQMLMSALLIHLSGGRIETHFHIFGSLAFLACYRDRRVLLTASVVVVVDHFVRGVFFPLSAFGVLTASPYRWMEHAGWVVFEDIFLLIAARQSLDGMRGVAERQALLEAVNANIEMTIAERTAQLTREIAERKQADEARKELARQLTRERLQYEEILNNIPMVVFENIPEGSEARRFINNHVEKFHGYSKREWNATPDFWRSTVHPEDQRRFNEEFAAIFAGAGVNKFIGRWIAKDGRIVWGETNVIAVRDEGGRIIGVRGCTIDITERVNAEAEKRRTRAELMDASRKAGMAEVAINVLHNVGNVLNSVNVSQTMIHDRVRKSELGGVKKTAELLAAHAADLCAYLSTNAAGQKITGYLALLGDTLAEEQKVILAELECLGRNVEHIKDVIALQQVYARAGGVHENIAITRLLDDALQIEATELTQHRIAIVRENGEIPATSLDKHKVMQILVNLISNARQALVEGGAGDRRLTVRAGLKDETLSVSVSDNGIGIAPETLTRIFAHGFTTKKNGHGYGLHSSALAAKEMGGQLTVHSDGVGKGATFTVEIPAVGKG
jgi:PAS domain S-box-containing protein